MRILALQGMPDTGKTKTINLVWDMLTTPTGKGVSTTRQFEGNPAQNDFSDIVMIGNRRIAFFSMGDYANALSKAINTYAYQGCDMLICALSTNSTKVHANSALDKFSARRITKKVELDPDPNIQLATNTADAQAIFNLIF